MRCVLLRFALTTLAIAGFMAVAPLRAEEPVHRGTEAMHCLDQKERRAESETDHLVRLSVAMRVAKSRVAGAVVRARLCRNENGLVYVLTVLAHDGKVARIAVDAVKGTLLGGL